MYFARQAAKSFGRMVFEPAENLQVGKISTHVRLPALVDEQIPLIINE